MASVSRELAKVLSDLNLPLLYRHTLQLAARFPSKKRRAILEEIKAEFHRNKSLTDPKVVMEKRRLALESLDQLRAYCGAAASKGDAQIYLKGPLQN